LWSLHRAAGHRPSPEEEVMSIDEYTKRCTGCIVSPKSPPSSTRAR
jgi:hypothetical protein